MVIKKETVVHKNISDTWQLLGPAFPDAYKWASAVNHSEGKGKPFNGAACSERGCATTIGQIKEKLLSYSAEDYSLSYQLSEGLPSVVKYASNSWKLTPIGPDKTRLNIRMDIMLGGIIGIIMQPLMRIQLSNLGNNLIGDFKHYVEKGHPSPKKLLAIKNWNGRQ